MNSLISKLGKRNLKLMFSIGFGIALYLVRVQLTHSLYFAFLLWNLFLAGVPYIMTRIMLSKFKKIRSTITLFWSGFALWLLFLPNSPYVITDMVYLDKGSSDIMWLNLLMIFVFAFNGLLLGLLSLLDMESILRWRFSSKTTMIILFASCMASGYGIYLGRFLRFNSWDIIGKPGTLFFEILNSFSELKVWSVTLAFGLFLWIFFQLFRAMFAADH